VIRFATATTTCAALLALALVGCDTGSREERPTTTATTNPGATASPAPSGGTSSTTPVTSSGAAPASSSTPAAVPSANSLISVFQFDPTITRAANLWHIDFDGLGDVFHRNCVGHGLGVASEPPDAPINRLTRERVIAACMRRINTAYFRTPEGNSQGPQQSLDISFQAITPDPATYPDGPGRDYSRICLGSRENSCTGGTLGVETVDPGNRRAERACVLNQLGTFAGRICGQNSTLGRRAGGPLTLADLKFVDGTYALGNGTAQEDQRFQAIRAVIQDWGTSLGNVVAHEVGHSVGLNHVADGIMIATTNARDLSDVNLPFTQPSIDVLARNIGVTAQ